MPFTFLVFVVTAAMAFFFSTIAAGGAAALLVAGLSLIYSPMIVVPAVSLAAAIANPFRAWLFRRHINWPVALYLVTGSILGATVGAYIFVQLASSYLQILLALFLICTAIEQTSRRFKINLNIKTWWFFPLGMSVAIVSAVVGAAGAVHNPFLLKYGLVKQTLIATKAINSSLMQITKLIAYGYWGLYHQANLNMGICLGLGAMLGIYAGGKVLLKIDKQQFISLAAWFMFASGLTLLVRAGIELL